MAKHKALTGSAVKGLSTLYAIQPRVHKARTLTTANALVQCSSKLQGNWVTEQLTCWRLSLTASDYRREHILSTHLYQRWSCHFHRELDQHQLKHHAQLQQQLQPITDQSTVCCIKEINAPTNESYVPKYTERNKLCSSQQQQKQLNCIS